MTGDGRVSRRAVLGSGAGALAALAGCSAVRDAVGGEPTGTGYDADEIAAAMPDRAPREPETFPVPVTAAMLSRHRERARALLADVPEQPDVPNEALAAELAAKRTEAASELGKTNDEGDGRESAMDRLYEARRRRSAAAGVAGAYRAATGGVDPQTVVAWSERVRGDLLSFRRDWRYATASPASGVVLHAELESRVRECRHELADWPPFPDDQADAVFRVGRVFEALEGAAASLDDAARFRERYVNARDAAPYRYGIHAAANQLGEEVFRTERWLGDYLEDESFPPGGDDTTAAAAWRAVSDTIEDAGERDADRERRPATAVLELGNVLAARHAAAALVDRIETGGVSPPADAAAVAARFETARQALTDAWATSPTGLAVAFAESAFEQLRWAHDELREEVGATDEVADVAGWLHYVELHAKAVPRVVDTAGRALPASRE